MRRSSIEPLDRLKQAFQRLPGIGTRSAERLAFHILRCPADEASTLARAIEDVKNKVRHCSVCYNLTEDDPCPICQDPGRDARTIVVVEQPKDVLLLEETGLVRGRYHVLMGNIVPLEGVEPGDLTIDALVRRVRTEGVSEVIMCTSPTLDGDGTALYIRSLLESDGVKVTRLARGVPVGSQLEYATPAMLEAALSGRTLM